MKEFFDLIIKELDDAKVRDQEAIVRDKEQTILLTRMEADLAYHIRRTDLLEDKVSTMDTENQARHIAIREELRPVRTHVVVVNAVIKIALAIAGLGATIAGIYRALIS